MCGARRHEPNGDSDAKVFKEAFAQICNGTCDDCKSLTDPKKKNDAGSKQARVVEMLRSPTGMTIASMMKETGWQQHSVRGFLAGVVRKKLKLKPNSKKIDGSRVYRVDGADSAKQSGRKSKSRTA